MDVEPRVETGEMVHLDRFQNLYNFVPVMLCCIDEERKIIHSNRAVSYTHLTLPTKRIV